MPNCEGELFVNHVLLIAKQYCIFVVAEKRLLYLKFFMSRLRKIQNLELVIAKSKNIISLSTKKRGNFNL